MNTHTQPHAYAAQTKCVTAMRSHIVFTWSVIQILCSAFLFIRNESGKKRALNSWKLYVLARIIFSVSLCARPTIIPEWFNYRAKTDRSFQIAPHKRFQMRRTICLTFELNKLIFFLCINCNKLKFTCQMQYGIH